MLTLKELLTTPQKIDPHIVYPLLPEGGMLLLVAEEKSGKSMLVGNIIYQLAGGLPVFGLKQYAPKEAVRVQYFDQENGDWLVKKRMIKVHEYYDSDKALENMYVTSRDLRLNFSTDKGRGLFYYCLDKVQPKVVVFDTIRKMHMADENKHTEMHNMWHPINEQLQKRGIASILVHHMNKPGEFRSGMGLDRSRGAYWTQEANTIVMMKRNGRTSNLAELEVTLRSEMSPPTIKLEYDKNTGLFAATQKIVVAEDVE